MKSVEEFVDRVRDIAEEHAERLAVTELLRKAKVCGYKKVWVGAVHNPHWTLSSRSSDGVAGRDFVIAEPKRKDPSDKSRGFSGWPAIWSCIAHGCGNGLKNADQCQARNMRFKYYAGEYDLTGATPKLVSRPLQEAA